MFVIKTWLIIIITIMLNLLKYYFNNITQYVSFSNTKSEIRNIKSEVLQGSILCPLPFILYVNDNYMQSM